MNTITTSTAWTCTDTANLYNKTSKFLRRTPLWHSAYFSEKYRCNVHLKYEHLQHTGSFKPRGVFSKISTLSPKQLERGLCTASAGNCGMAVSYAANQCGASAHVYLPSNTPAYKVEKIKQLGGQTYMYGEVWDDANAYATNIAEQEGLTYIHAFDDEDMIQGHATIALEIVEDLPNIDVAICSIGGGGLISGVAKFFKRLDGHIRTIGVETIGTDSMYQSIEADKIISLDGISSIAEGLGATTVVPRTFEYTKKYVDELFTVTDEDAMQALAEILQEEKQLVEPAASCCVAALEKIPDIEGKNVAIVLCGSNFPLEKLYSYSQVS